MADKRRFLDVWIVESNTVYQEVPYTVVVDWVQQGRLLEDDKLKPSGTKEWLLLGGMTELTPYLPRPEPHRAEDQAEALDPVHVDFEWKKPKEDEDDEVDMIPLIDVSLVLLIFFMLTAGAAAVAAPVLTPATENGEIASEKEGMRVDINLEDGAPVFSVRVGDKQPSDEDSDLRDFNRLLERIKAHLPASGQTDLIINAHKDLKAKTARDLLLALQAEPFRGKVRANYYGVRESEP